MPKVTFVEANGTKPFMIRGRYARGIAGDLYDVIKHGPLLVGDRRGAVVGFERCYQSSIQRDATQKLCVRLDSIMAPIGYGHHRRDHLVLLTTQRQIGRHQRTKSREGVKERRRGCVR